MINFIRLSFLMLCLPLALRLSAQEVPLIEDARFERLSIADGLPYNTIRSLIMDTEGFLLIAYGNGLIRYDGYDFVFLNELGQFTPSGNSRDAMTSCADYKGNIWIPGIEGSMAVYNKQQGLAYKLQLLPPADTSTTPDILWVREGRNGQIVFLAATNSFYIFDPAELSWPDTSYLPHSLIQPLITDRVEIPERYGKLFGFEIDTADGIWFATWSPEEDGLGHYDLEKKAFTLFLQETEDPLPGYAGFTNVVLDTSGALWLGGDGQIARFDLQTHQFQEFLLPQSYRDQMQDIFMWLAAPGADGRLLVNAFYFELHAVDRNKLLWFDPATARYSRIREQLDRTHRRPEIGAVCSDPTGNIWLGATASLYKYNPEKNRFRFQRSSSGSDIAEGTTSTTGGGLKGVGNTVLFEDAEKVIWIGSSDGILNRWDRKDGSYKYFQHRPGDPKSLLPGRITAILRDARGTLWVGSQNGLSRQNPDGSFRHYQRDPDDPKSQTGNYVTLLLEDSRQHLWVGIDNNSPPHARLYIYDPACDCLQVKIRDENFYITRMREDQKGLLWLNDGNDGMWSYEWETDQLTKHPWEGSQGWFDIHFDSGGNLWTTWFNRPLIKYDPSTGAKTEYDLYGLFPTNPIRRILADDEDKLWLVCRAGLIHFDPVAGQVINLYSPQNWMSEGESWFEGDLGAIKTAESEFIIGCSGGVLSFDPRKININRQPPTTEITGLEVDGEPLRLAPGSGLIRRTFREEIVLPHHQNDLSIRYSALHFKEPKRNQFAYQLEGWDDDWLRAGNQRSATYANIDPGRYTFRVKAANSDGIWMADEDAVRLAITIRPPWWATWWAYALYAFLIAGLLWSLYRWRTRIQRRRLAEVEQINIRLTQLDKLKDQFLANTSHELRTPLNGIIGIAESLRDGIAGQLPKRAHSNLNLIISSGKRLANLVNDVLDLSKLKNQELILLLRPVDMHSAIDVVFALSEPVIQHKELTLVNQIPRNVPLVEADENRIQQILHNLVGNAIKFTERGTISISSKVQDGFLRVSVSDTGIGIPEDKFGRIFQSFEQAQGDTAREYGGTGLGLSVTRQLVELHGGKIWVESPSRDHLTPGTAPGSVFHFTLPLSKENREKLPESVSTKAWEPIVAGVDPDPGGENDRAVAASLGTRSGARVLIVDDEPVNLQVLENHLSLAGYQVRKASSGMETLNIIREERPFDLIILDIMMPKMSGYEVCHQLRELFLPSELPVVLLTAKNRVADLVEGFSVGANDYLTKPFSKDELLSRIRTHLNLHLIHRSTGKFVPFEFLRAVGRESITEVQLGDHMQKEVTVFFSDIRDYTRLAEKMRPDENFQFINNYLGAMGPVVRRHRGFINQYQGDGIMAIFPESPADALSASIDMQNALHQFNHKRLKDGLQPIRVGIGLHTGPLIMGIIGDQDRMEATTIADTVNTASRIEGLTKYYGTSILLSEDSLGRIEDQSRFSLRYLGKVQVKGKAEPFGLYECYEGDIPAIAAGKVNARPDFEEGLRQYFDREFGQAVATFDRILKINPDDEPARLFMKKASEYLIQGVPDDWTGVEVMAFK